MGACVRGLLKATGLQRRHVRNEKLKECEPWISGFRLARIGIVINLVNCHACFVPSLIPLPQKEYPLRLYKRN